MTEQAEYGRTANLVLLGDSETRKTSSVNRLVNHRHCCEYRKTIGGDCAVEIGRTHGVRPELMLRDTTGIIRFGTDSLLRNASLL